MDYILCALNVKLDSIIFVAKIIFIFLQSVFIHNWSIFQNHWKMCIMSQKKVWWIELKMMDYTDCMRAAPGVVANMFQGDSTYSILAEIKDQAINSLANNEGSIWNGDESQSILKWNAIVKWQIIKQPYDNNIYWILEH